MIMILDAVSASPHPASAAEVAETTGLSISTVSRLMIEFAEAGLLHRSERDRRYTLGPKIYALSRAAESGLDLESIGRPLLERLRDTFGETVSMHVLRGRQRVCVVEVPSPQPLRRVIPVGTAEPVAGSATGAVLLADTPAEELADLLEDLPAERRDWFRDLVGQASRNGWVIAESGWIPDLTGVSAPILVGKKVRAAVSISGPSSRFDRIRAEACVEALVQVTTEITARVDGSTPAPGALSGQ
nr:IclR family transcriptional regulator [Pseudonocardia acidicola]